MQTTTLMAYCPSCRGNGEHPDFTDGRLCNVCSGRGKVADVNAIPAHLQAALNKIMVLAATANCAGENAEDAYRALSRICEEARQAVAIHDDILYPSPNFDDEGDVIYGPEEEAPF